MALWPYIWRHPGMVLAALVAPVASAAAMLTVPVAVRRMIDHGFSGADGVFMDMYFAMLIVIGLVLAVASAGRMYAVNWLGERVVADLRAQVFRHLATLGPAFYETTHSGEVMSRLTADTTQIKGAAGSALEPGAAQSHHAGRRARHDVRDQPDARRRWPWRRSRPSSFRCWPTAGPCSGCRARPRTALPTLRPMPPTIWVPCGPWRPSARKRPCRGALRRPSSARSRRRATGLLARAGLTAIAIFLVVASVVGVLWFGSRLVISGEMTGGRLGQFILYAVFAAGAMAELAEVWGELAQAAGATERLLELLAARPAGSAHRRGPKTLPVPPLGTVQFKDVHFAYPARPGVSALNGVSFEVARGRDGGSGRAVGRGQEHDLQPDPALL